MAIEDGYALACDLADAVKEARNSTSTSSTIDIARVLRGYERQRIPRAAAIHGLARLAAGRV